MQTDGGAFFAACGLPQCAGCPQDQIVIAVQDSQVTIQYQFAIRPPLYFERVSIVDELEDRLQFVIAVWTPPCDVQEQIQLGRCLDAQKVVHGAVGAEVCSVQSRRTKSSRRGGFSMRMRVGRDSVA